jgi:hypothetical protein
MAKRTQEAREQRIEDVTKRQDALHDLAHLYLRFLDRHRRELQGCLTENEVAEMARLKALYESTLTPDDLVGGGPLDVFNSPLRLRHNSREVPCVTDHRTRIGAKPEHVYPDGSYDDPDDNYGG